MRKHILIPLDKYRSLMQRACPPQEGAVATSTVEYDDDSVTDSAPDSVPDMGLSTEHILTVIPKHAQNRARALVDILRPHLQWNDRGEILVRDEPIQNSHIADLVKYTVVRHLSRQLPIGGREYAAVLASINIPRTLVVNERLPIEPPTTWQAITS
jgi:hypothetical protein